MINESDRQHTIRAHTNWIGVIRTGVHNPERATQLLWRILEELEAIGATPKDIGSNDDEIEELLQAYSVTWDEWAAGRRRVAAQSI